MTLVDKIGPPARLIDGLRARYGEPQRHYHTWAHIGALLRHFEIGHVRLHRPKPVLWALFWHDAIYDPTRKDNEEMSAQLLIEEARSELSSDDLAFAAAIIRATATHELIEGLNWRDREDMSFFLDIDLSILAASPDAFAAYEANIRKEYAFVPDEKYKAARAAVLTKFLGRDRIYYTPVFLHAWEAKARTNLRGSIAALT